MSQAPVPHTVITSRQTENTPLAVSMEDHYPQSYETVTDRPPAALIRDEEEEDACSRTGSTASTQSRAFRRGSNSSAMPWGGHSQPSVHFEGGPRSGAMPAAQGSVEKQANSTIPLNRKRLLHNALHMSTCFAANEGCLTAVLAVSSAIINPHLFATSAGTLYLSFAFGTIVAPALVNLTGLRLSLVLGLASYTLYIGCFIFPSWYSLIPSSAIAGLLGSLLWTSQGVYFTTNAVLYSEASLGDIPLRSVSVPAGAGSRTHAHAHAHAHGNAHQARISPITPTLAGHFVHQRDLRHNFPVLLSGAQSNVVPHPPRWLRILGDVLRVCSARSRCDDRHDSSASVANAARCRE